jgi:hypothetical protein
MRGGYGYVSREQLSRFPAIITSLGHKLATNHQTSFNWAEIEAGMDYVYIHDRDFEGLKKSTVGIFEISNPSLGVGAEISDMILLGKPVMCLIKKGLESHVSAYIQGKKGSKFVKTPFECYEYDGMEHAKELIKKFVDKHTAKI